MQKNINLLIEKSKKKYADNDELLAFMDTLEFIFFNAVDAKNNEHLKYKKYFSPVLSILKRAMLPTHGELACYASHFELWCECIKINENIIVLEDDVDFDEDFINSIFEVSKSNYKYVRLYFTDKKFFIHLHDNFYFTKQSPAGAAGYYLTPFAANAFINEKKWDLPVDLVLDSIYRHKIDNILYIKNGKMPVKMQELETQIPNRYNVKKRFIFKVLREIFRIYLATRIGIFNIFYKKPK